jgi:hypothetical protein
VQKEEETKQQKAEQEEKEILLASMIKKGSRCEIDSDGPDPKRGEVMYIGIDGNLFLKVYTHIRLNCYLRIHGTYWWCLDWCET